MEKEADVPQLHKIAYGKLNHHNHNFWANVDGCDDVVATEEWSSCGVGGLGWWWWAVMVGGPVGGGGLHPSLADISVARHVLKA